MTHYIRSVISIYKPESLYMCARYAGLRIEDMKAALMKIDPELYIQIASEKEYFPFPKTSQMISELKKETSLFDKARNETDKRGSQRSKFHMFLMEAEKYDDVKGSVIMQIKRDINSCRRSVYNYITRLQEEYMKLSASKEGSPVE